MTTTEFPAGPVSYTAQQFWLLLDGLYTWNAGHPRDQIKLNIWSKQYDEISLDKETDAKNGITTYSIQTWCDPGFCVIVSQFSKGSQNQPNAELEPARLFWFDQHTTFNEEWETEIEIWYHTMETKYLRKNPRFSFALLS